MPLDSQKLRETMRLWATGVTVVGSRHGDTLRGLTVSSFTSVTLEPPLVLVCLQKTTEAADAILSSRAYSVSMLGQGHETLSNRFAGFEELPPGVDRYDDIPLIFAETGSPILADAMGWLDCRLHAVLDGSTHHIFMGEVVAASGLQGEAKMPLIYYNRAYRKVE